MTYPTSEQRQTYLEIATEAALSAGAALKHYYGNLQQVREKDTPGDLITEADTASEKIIIELLQRQCPDLPIHAEESGQISGAIDSPFLWMIDPLDGTVNYAHGYPMFSVSIALLYEENPVVGVVYNPYRDELFRAAEGAGATLNRKPIHVSKTEKLQDSLLTTGFAYDRRQTKDNNYIEFCCLTHKTQGVRRGGSAALDLTDVACGRLDGYWERGIQPWDMSAGICILREAGGLVTAYDESPLKLQNGRLLATNHKIHSQLSQTLGSAKGWFMDYYKS
ncbi:Inositol-phosphate phosphatase [[Leptolyngbya] sp. PCC 7376]|uniref:inositol monophosphatase family protein n=1 Tax=[Leptolyngbya] sp. PCC 7376 TaxID=111781 RepID=UPI00029F2076|nr:inositol monophosphatase family protein [[Leptolyngbya] sp. PCC 7376]AFY39587.1 Inositol-phosphate phosphatase [[Leptolyngbya] sp. PCC 7376]